MTQDQIARILDAIAALGRDQQTTAKGVVRLEAKVEAIAADNTDADIIHADIETRMRVVERIIQRVIGLGTVGGVVLGATGGAIVSYVLR